MGLVTGTIFADLGNEVTCIDADRKKVEGLKKGVMPIYEPGLEEMVQHNAADGRLTFSTDLKSAVRKSDRITSYNVCYTKLLRIQVIRFPLYSPR